MNDRFVIVCFEIPTQGGAATSAYALFAKMKRDGMDVHFLNIVERTVVPYYLWVYGVEFGNPEGLPDVHTCVVERPLYRAQASLTEALDNIGADVAVARGYIATLLVRLAAPELRLVLSTAGSHQAEFLIAHGRVAQAFDLPALVPRTARLPTEAPGHEGAALDAADLVLAGSDLVRDIIRTFYNLDRSYKVHDESVWSAEWVVEAVAASGVEPEPFEERSIDVLFCATDWRRGEKNLPGVRRIVAGLDGLRVTIAGECTTPVVVGARHVGRIVDRIEMLRLMADSKVVASASLVDACPTTLFEAAALGCNVVASKNCGNWRLCHEELLVDPPGDAGMTAAVRRGVAAPFESGLGWFLQTCSYKRLLEILHALAA